MTKEETKKSKEPKYEVVGENVFEVIKPCCANDKTIGLKRQIEAFFCLAGKEVRVKIEEVDKPNEFTSVDDKTIRALSGLPSFEMKEHLEMYHPHRDHRRIECPDCGKFVKKLYPTEGCCLDCYFIRTGAHSL